MNASEGGAEVVYAATSVAELEPPKEPEPATVAPEGTGNWLGQFGGNWPSRERDTWPLGVETWKFWAVLAGAGLAALVAGLAVVVAGLAVDELLLEQPAAAARQPSRRPTASRDFDEADPSLIGGHSMMSRSNTRLGESPALLPT